jgi:hypothetical protein
MKNNGLASPPFGGDQTNTPSGNQSGSNPHMQFRKTTNIFYEGCTKELRGHIDDYGVARQADIWTTTTKEICEYVFITLKYGSDTITAIRELSEPLLEEAPEPEPIPPLTTITKAQSICCDERIKEGRESQLQQNIRTVYAII